MYKTFIPTSGIIKVRDWGLQKGKEMSRIADNEKLDLILSTITELKTDVSELKTDITELKSDFTVLKADFTELKTDVTELKADVTELKSDVTELKSDVTELKSDVTELKSNVSVLNGKVYDLDLSLCNLQTDVKTLSRDVTLLKMTLENETNRNIQIVAEGHLDLYRKMVQATSTAQNAESLIEMHSIRLNRHDNQIAALKMA